MLTRVVLLKGTTDRNPLGFARPWASEGRRALILTESEQLPGPVTEPALRKEGPIIKELNL